LNQRIGHGACYSIENDKKTRFPLLQGPGTLILVPLGVLRHAV
jgi:hypothetical protein